MPLFQTRLLILVILLYLKSASLELQKIQVSFGRLLKRSSVELSKENWIPWPIRPEPPVTNIVTGVSESTVISLGSIVSESQSPNINPSFISFRNSSYENSNPSFGNQLHKQNSLVSCTGSIASWMISTESMMHKQDQILEVFVMA